jgi:Eukaryotic aspartyl protease
MAHYISLLLGVGQLALSVAAFPAALDLTRIPISNGGPKLRARAPDNSTLTATDHDGGIFYTCPVTIGEGAGVKTVRLNFDTGSPDLWTVSTLMSPSEQAIGTHTYYDPLLSTSSQALNKTWGISYVDGSFASGLAYLDTVDLGGLVLKQTGVEAANDVDTGTLSSDADGLLGLSLDQNTIKPSGSVSTTIQNLIRHPLAQNVFTCALTRPSEPDGFYTFGYIDQTLTAGKEILYTDILGAAGKHDGRWEFTSSFMTLNNQTIQRPGNTAIADTGTTIIFIDGELLSAIYAPLGGQLSGKYWYFPANLPASSLPTINLPAGANTVTLRPEDLAYSVSTDGQWFMGSIQSRGSALWDTFGDVWLRNIYAIHDVGMTGVGKQRFGLVPRPYGVI